MYSQAYLRDVSITPAPVRILSVLPHGVEGFFTILLVRL